MKRILMLFIITMTFIFCSCSDKKNFTVSSPDGNLKVEIDLIQNGKLFYKVLKNYKVIIDHSKLGLILKNDVFNDNFRVVTTSTKEYSESWETVWGTDKIVYNNYNEMILDLINEKNQQLKIYFKLYDDGLGFRYEIPEQEGIDSIQITNELTEFNIAEEGKAWWIHANYESYEMLYKTTPIDSVIDANTPITMKTVSGDYISIHEANLTDYAGMTLVNKGTREFEAELVPWPDGIKVKGQGTLVSPWRTITITDNAGDHLTSKLILNLNEPNKLKDVSWIKPVKYVGIWWGMHLGTETWTEGPRHGATTKNMKRYIDFASENNIDAVLAEGWNTGWEHWGRPEAFDFTTPYSDYDFDEIVEYAASKGIKLIGHHETGGDIYAYEQLLDTALKMLNKNGINMLKTGYAGPIPDGQKHHGQWMVNHYRKVVEAAAEYKISINAHEPIKPTGISRTFPNMMTREGVRGMEWNAWSEGNPPEHHVIIPFTRGLGGPIDYTPGTFDILYENRGEYVKWNGNDKGNSRVNTTLAKQLALWVVLYSPMQMASDIISNYEGHPAFQFFRDLPRTYDKSIVLDAEIGEYIIVARKKDDSWYIGAITDEKGREFDVELSFLDESDSYSATIYADGEDADWKANPTSYKIDTTTIRSDTNVKLHLAAGGGQAISLIKK